MDRDMSKISAKLDFRTVDGLLESIFNDTVKQGEMYDAIDFVRSIESQFLPSTEMMKSIIFQIMMKSDDVKAAAFAADYLNMLLDTYIPENEKSRNFYFDSIRDDHGFLSNLWTVFDHIVHSNMIQKRIYDSGRVDPIKYPNCRYLLDFYINLFVKDFKYYKCDNSSPCLILKLFWPDCDVRRICLNSQTNLLFQWINDSYKNNVPYLMYPLQEMLVLVIRCIIEEKHELSNTSAFNSAPMCEIVAQIVQSCKDVFCNLNNVRTFLSFVPDNLSYFRVKLCDKLIKQLIKVSSRKYSIFTLKDIVEQCMFPLKPAALKIHNKPVVKKKKELRKRVDKKIFADMKMETTKLHELCRKNKFADLLEELNVSDVDINARDSHGNTPLHEACAVNAPLCVQNLIDEGCSDVGPTLDFAACNLEGITPLHVAVMNDFTEIAIMLLSHGGAELLTKSDNKGRLPGQFSKSTSMDNLLREFDSALSVKLSESSAKDPTESDSSLQSTLSKENLGSVPSFKTFREYAIYVDCLNCLLCCYCELFNLYEFVWEGNIEIASHSNKSCCHFKDKNVCSQDVDALSQIHDLADNFMHSLHKNASKHNLIMEIEVIPLESFVKSIPKDKVKKACLTKDKVH